MKTFLKYLYYFVIIATFVIFFMFLGMRYEQFKQGWYDTPEMDKEHCSDVGGIAMIVNGEWRCYLEADRYLTIEELGKTNQMNESGRQPTTFEECKTWGGEVYNNRCYTDEETFFEQNEIIDNQRDGEDEEQKIEENIAEDKNNKDSALKEDVQAEAPSMIDENNRTPTSFQGCQDNKGQIEESLFGWRCYWTESLYFDREKTEQEIVDSVKNYNDCVEVGGEVYENRCYMSDTKFYEQGQ